MHVEDYDHYVAPRRNLERRSFWLSLLLYWARFVPFWVGVAFGAAVTFLVMR